MNKSYIENLYKSAIADFKCAHNEDERWAARMDMARIERYAIEQLGHTYVETVLGALKENVRMLER